MTLTNPVTKSGPYSTDGVNRDWDYDFSVASKYHIRLTVTTGATVEDIVPAAFDIVGIDEAEGGTITYPILPDPPLASGSTVNIERVTPYEQPTDLTNQGRWFPQVVEDALDNLARQTQQLDALYKVITQQLEGVLALDPAPLLTPASAVTVVTNANLLGATVQAALEELQTEILAKADASHTHSQADITGLSAALAQKMALTTVTAKGDVLIHNGVSPTRLPVGANSKYLKANSAVAEGLEWANAGIVDQQVFTVSGTWNKPANISVNALIRIRAWGGGGSGAHGGGGGGGGGFNERWLLASALGATEIVTVGLGGAAVTVASNGNVGGATTFGTHLTAYGGGGGGYSSNIGGGGGGQFSGGSGSLPGRPTLGAPSAGRGGDAAATPPAPFDGFWHGGGGGYQTVNGAHSVWGGGGGGGGYGTSTGGQSVNAGAGGAGNNSTSGVAGTAPGGAGGGTGTGASSGAGANGRVEVVVFDGSV